MHELPETATLPARFVRGPDRHERRIRIESRRHVTPPDQRHEYAAQPVRLAMDEQNRAGRSSAFSIATPLRPGWATWLRCPLGRITVVPLPERADAAVVLHLLRAVVGVQHIAGRGQSQPPPPSCPVLPEQLQHRLRRLHLHVRPLDSMAHPSHLVGGARTAPPVPLSDVHGVDTSKLPAPRALLLRVPTGERHRRRARRRRSPGI